MDIRGFFSKNAPAILSIGACVGVVVTAVLAVKATPKAIDIIEECEKEKYAPLTKFEKMQVTAKTFAPAAAACAATIACIIASHKMSVKQIAQATAALAAVREAFVQYRSKVFDIDKDVHCVAMNEISKDRHPDSPELVFNKSEQRTFMIHDGTEERYFTATMEDVLAAEYNINKEIALNGEAPLSNFYHDLGIEDANDSEFMGWSNDMLCDWYGNCWVDFENRICESDPNDPDSPEFVEIIFYQEPAPGWQDGTWEDYFMHRDDILIKTMEAIKADAKEG